MDLMKNSIFLFCIFFQSLTAQNPGDTIEVQTFNYVSHTRDTIAYFPDDTTITFEKIIMSYNIRCKDNVVNTSGGNTTYGCGAWDYNCHTYIHDSSRVDSVLSFTPDHIISNFSGTNYDYSNIPIYNFYKYIQYKTLLDSILHEDTISIGNGTADLGFVIETNQLSNKSQFLYPNLFAQNDTLSSLSLYITTGSQWTTFLRIRLKLTQDSILLPQTPHVDGFTEVYYANTLLSGGNNRFQFYQTFELDTNMNLIVEFSFNDSIYGLQTIVKGEFVSDSIGLHSNDATHIEINSAEHINIPSGPLSSISDEITISLWVYGDENVLPVNTTLFEGLDTNGHRTVNVHFPWNNSRIYWDCGNTGTSYDRIDKAANLTQYAGQWNHWTFTKNSNTGIMKIYLNGILWHSGSGKTRLMNINSFKLGSKGNGMGYFWDGKIKEFRIFNKELSDSVIADWANVRINNNHPNYINLVAYYPFNEGIGIIANDNSPFGQIANFNGNVQWKNSSGNNITSFFTSTSYRPNIDFYSGDYIVTIVNDTILDSVQAVPNIVITRLIFPNYGTSIDDSIGITATDTLWESIRYIYTYDSIGVIVHTQVTHIDSTLIISDLTYYKRYPMAFQIMSFVTPYGGWLDLGSNGKTWYFDVTDFTPILQGNKRITVSGGGQWQEDMDIKFLFIVGTPPRDVIDMQQIWRPQSKGYGIIMAEKVFEPRNVEMHSGASQYKIRTVITGHGQEGEFIPQSHYLNIDGGTQEYLWQVWTECSDNPIYPQGGTWIYDRAGWCPGKPSDLREDDITSLVSPGQVHNIDYGVSNAIGNSNYWVSSQLVSYGTPNFNLDVSVIDVLSPTNKAKYLRTNPICSKPLVLIQNTGSDLLTSLTIEYWINNTSIRETFSWTGNLAFLEKEIVELPSPSSLWQSQTIGNNIFYVEIKDPNGSVDQYIYNNYINSPFTPAPTYPNFFGLCVQTNSGTSLPFISETSWDIYDDQGNTMYTSGTLSWGTIYRDTIQLNNGCYRFVMTDTDDDGLDFWANNDGSGMVTFVTNPISCNSAPVKIFDPDFGRYIIHEFTIATLTSIGEKTDNDWKIYPNPTNEFVIVEGIVDAVTDIIVTNILGENIQKHTIRTNGKFSKEIILSPYPKGMYFIKLQNPSEQYIKKIVKQ